MKMYTTCACTQKLAKEIEAYQKTTKFYANENRLFCFANYSLIIANNYRYIVFKIQSQLQMNKKLVEEESTALKEEIKKLQVVS